jgi:hypothetical protein
MIKKIKIIYLATILPVLLFGACEKEGTHLMPKIKAINKNFDISGFVFGDTIEQYFDNVKIREYYGPISLGGAKNQLVFVTDEIKMELRKKSTGEAIYRQTFNITDQQNVVPKFFFDGTTLAPRYNYTDPLGNEYRVNFYLNPSKITEPIDVNVEVLEYYIDTKGKAVVVNSTAYPIALNIQPGVWVNDAKVEVPVLPAPTRNDTEFYPLVAIRNSKTKEYYINKDVFQSEIKMEIPYDGVSIGKVQSYFLSKALNTENLEYLEQYDLVQMFPR